MIEKEPRMADTKTTAEDEDQSTEGAEIEDDEDQSTEGPETEDDEDEDDEEAVLASLDAKALALFERQRERLAKANASSRRRRKIITALRSGKTASEGTPKPGPKAPEKTGDAFDPEAFMAQVRAELKGEQETTRVQSAAERELKRAGLVLPEDENAAERKLARVMRMLDLKDVTADEVADEVADLKQDNPELFKRVRKPKPRTGGVSGPATIKGGKSLSAVDDLFG